MGVVLGVRRHGENAAVVTLMSEDQGRYAGLVRGAQSKRLRGVLQPGNRVEVSWRARLEDHLGTMTVELDRAHAAALLTDAGRLAALSSACALVDTGLPEREPHPDLYRSLDALMVALEADGWAETYCRWEIGLLAELGFGLDLASCAVSGVVEGLTHVSPRTGRAVSAEAAAPYRDRLLSLPGFLRHNGMAGDGDIDAALTLTGHFLQRHVYDVREKPLPDPRTRLWDRFRR